MSKSTEAAKAAAPKDTTLEELQRVTMKRLGREGESFLENGVMLYIAAIPNEDGNLTATEVIRGDGSTIGILLSGAVRQDENFGSLLITAVMHAAAMEEEPSE